MSINWPKFMVLMLMLGLLGFSSPVLAVVEPQANINSTNTIVPSKEMAKQQGIPSTGPLQETMLNDSDSTLMTTVVAGVFIILPVGICIFLHQRKKSRK
ncbi:MAG TPA: hypothetical protein ENH19_01370 [Actinobacteria bacterium]|nr:hypothetical protein [Actinomycetes bacterium]HEX21286.1 hypothetical protein [Actinomycetota bacterium]